ncbi:bifunctional 2-polyprenyl-6-hydroxyphenol methylase/3-demethylubiquinol 3-O-methyltransferase UbiG [uncultured Serinicoccus sp.]|uniref:class I SAM-dependent methyltransferase n=1 Tax=uncultured Serinicoccus sp. TaxID=735514 RepID=UPI002607A51A|nr:class I SAM-dependent methyltransferase [uncultured Serinicoccus sp.]
MSQHGEELTRAAYDAVADLYADTFTATEPEQPLELAMIDHFVALLGDGPSVLDAGCGAGRMLPQLAARGCRPRGVDLSPEMVRRARADHPAYPSALGSLSDLDFADELFDGVFSWYSTIHTPDDHLDRVLSQLARVLRPGGHVLLAFQVGDGVRDVGRGFTAYGHRVTLNRYHRSVPDVASRLERQGMPVVARLERGPVGSELDPQAVVVAQRPAV